MSGIKKGSLDELLWQAFRAGFMSGRHQGQRGILHMGERERDFFRWRALLLPDEIPVGEMAKRYSMLGDLTGMNNARLKSICRDWGIKFSQLDRDQMQEAIFEHPNNNLTN